jgi:hypothetical protein
VIKHLVEVVEDYPDGENDMLFKVGILHPVPMQYSWYTWSICTGLHVCMTM